MLVVIIITFTAVIDIVSTGSAALLFGQSLAVLVARGITIIVGGHTTTDAPITVASIPTTAATTTAASANYISPSSSSTTTRTC